MHSVIKLWDGREIDPPRLLVALHKRAGTAVLPAPLRALMPPLTEARAADILANMDEFTFDYLDALPFKIRTVKGVIDEHSATLFDRDAGEGAFALAVKEATGDT